MRAIIVASSPYDVFEQIYKPIPGDLIIGVDGGCKAIKKYPIDIAFGDFDSLQGPVEAKKVFHYPRQKKENPARNILEQCFSNSKCSSEPPVKMLISI